MECMAITLRASKQYDGIEINGTQNKVSIYAGDTNNAKPKVKSSIMIRDHCSGGLKQPDIEITLTSLKAKWFFRLLDKRQSKWRNIGMATLDKVGGLESMIEKGGRLLQRNFIFTGTAVRNSSLTKILIFIDSILELIYEFRIANDDRSF
uniref:Uncharacterized protein n=1 Tax=Romanomermis culicivorax TaxID=13658 RepID=A0A915J4C4_ROMCU